MAPPNPNQNNFSPPNPDDIRTIYVPYDDAVNVPDVFDVSVGSSFGYRWDCKLHSDII